MYIQNSKYIASEEIKSSIVQLVGFKNCKHKTFRKSKILSSSKNYWRHLSITVLVTFTVSDILKINAKVF